jgi:hypothetical protein
VNLFNFIVGQRAEQAKQIAIGLWLVAQKRESFPAKDQRNALTKGPCGEREIDSGPEGSPSRIIAP